MPPLDPDKFKGNFMDHLFISQLTLAYIDPGSGSAIMSAIIGVFVATGLILKTYWYKIKRFLGFKNKEVNQTEDGLDES